MQVDLLAQIDQPLNPENIGIRGVAFGYLKLAN